MSYVNLTMDNLFMLEEQPEKPCRGQVYRYHESAFPTGRGYGFNKRLVLLKRMSCPGCHQCYETLDDIEQGIVDSDIDFIEFSPQLRDGDLARLVFQPGHRDWETGYLETWHYKAVKHRDPTD